VLSVVLLVVLQWCQQEKRDVPIGNLAFREHPLASPTPSGTYNDDNCNYDDGDNNGNGDKDNYGDDGDSEIYILAYNIAK
jgi:hypothetical protein